MKAYVIFDHKKEKVYVVEENIYMVGVKRAVRQAWRKCWHNWQDQAPEEFTRQGLQAFISTIIWSKKV